MDILIKNMEMPKDCRYCPCVRFNKEYGIVRCHAVYDNCNEEDVVARDFDEVDMFDTTHSKPLEKPSWCPLVALPEHGDLIDRDALIKDSWASCMLKKKNDDSSRAQYDTLMGYEIRNLLEDAPTIVEATE